MSLIYDALRKSEEQRRRGEMPTLTTAPLWQPRRRQLPWLPVIVVVVLIAAAGGLWLGLRPPGQNPDSPVATTATAPAISPPPSTPTNAAGPDAAPPTPALTPAPAAPAPAALDSARPAGPEMNAAAPAPGESTVPVPVDPAPAVAAVPPELSSALPAAAPVPPAAPVTAPAAPVAALPAPVVLPPPAPAVDVPFVQSVWDLPLATRKALPALKLHMHVYNPDPARRFVIIDGTRAAEGAPLASELDVVEIRADGTVLAFRGERFLLPRSGH